MRWWIRDVVRVFGGRLVEVKGGERLDFGVVPGLST